MVVADVIASPRFFGRSLGIERMTGFTPSEFGGSSSRPGLLSQAKQFSSDRALADERAIAADESTATLDRHVSKACSGTGNKSVGIRGGLVGGGATASSVRTGKYMVPMTPLWSNTEVERVMVSPI